MALWFLSEIFLLISPAPHQLFTYVFLRPSSVYLYTVICEKYIFAPPYCYYIHNYSVYDEIMYTRKLLKGIYCVKTAVLRLIKSVFGIRCFCPNVCHLILTIYSKPAERVLGVNWSLVIRGVMQLLYTSLNSIFSDCNLNVKLSCPVLCY